MVYIVKLSDGTKLIYNAQSGIKLTGVGKIADDDDDDDLPKNFSVAVDITRAYELALAQNPGGKLKEAELDDEDGQVVYKFQFSSGTEVKISATDGSVVKIEKKSENKGKSSSKNRGSSNSDQDDGDRDDDGVDNNEDSDDDGDGQSDSEDQDDDNDGQDDSEDSDDDEDGVDDDEDEGEDEDESEDN